MSLITCSECSTEVSTSAKACPKCGASAKALRQPKGKKGWGLPAKLGLGFAGLVIIGSAIQNGSGPQQPKTESPEEIADKHRGKVAYDAVIALKSGLREPDSAQFDQILVDDAGTLVCLTYRGRNGFGGISREHRLFVDGAPSTKRSTWNKRCAGVTLNDYTGVARVARWLGP